MKLKKIHDLRTQRQKKKKKMSVIVLKMNRYIKSNAVLLRVKYTF